VEKISMSRVKITQTLTLFQCVGIDCKKIGLFNIICKEMFCDILSVVSLNCIYYVQLLVKSGTGQENSEDNPYQCPIHTLLRCKKDGK
jgi:hypothetical protein